MVLRCKGEYRDGGVSKPMGVATSAVAQSSRALRDLTLKNYWRFFEIINPECIYF